MKLSLVPLTALLLNFSTFAGDLGFRFVNGKCVNQLGREGLNTSYLGQCADFRNVILSRLDLGSLDLRGSTFEGSDLQKTSFVKADLSGVNFDFSILSGVDFTEAKLVDTKLRSTRLKNVILNESIIENTQFSDADFTDAQVSELVAKNSNFTRAKLKGLVIENAKFLNSDFSEASFEKSQLKNCDFEASKLVKTNLSQSRIEKSNFRKILGDGLNLTAAFIDSSDFSSAMLPKLIANSAEFESVNFSDANLEEALFLRAKLKALGLEKARLKGAQISKKTELPFSLETALQLGMIERRVVSAFVIMDSLSSAPLKSFLESLKSDELEITVSTKAETQYDPNIEALKDFDAVLHFNATTSGTPMPAAGLEALKSFVLNGGTYISGEYNSYEVDITKTMKNFEDLTPLIRTGNASTTATVTKIPEFLTHPILEGVADSFTVNSNRSQVMTSPRAYNENPAQVLLKAADGNPVLAVRKFGNGKVVHFSFACSNATCFTNTELQKLYRNAALWQSN